MLKAESSLTVFVNCEYEFTHLCFMQSEGEQTDGKDSYY